MTGNLKNDDALRETMLTGDPAAGDESLTAAEQHAIRGRLAQASPRVSTVASRTWWWRPVFAGGLVFALLFVLWNRPAHQGMPPPAGPASHQPPDTQPPPAAAGSPTTPPVGAGSDSTAREAWAPVTVRPAAPDSHASSARTVRMITRGGTQIVWSVNPGARF